MMSGDKHTPWAARPSGDGDGLWTVVDTNGGIVFFGMDEDCARLFAAAPEMYEALSDLLKIRSGRTVKAARAALAKAGGAA